MRVNRRKVETRAVEEYGASAEARGKSIITRPRKPQGGIEVRSAILNYYMLKGGDFWIASNIVVGW